MTDVRTLQRSFAGGEITPELLGRADLRNYQTGLALCRNCVVLPHGAVVKRPGTRFMIETKYSAKQSRLIPFLFSEEVTYILELGDEYIRFHTNGGTVVEASKVLSAATKANPAVVTVNSHGYSNGDTVFINGVVGMTELNGRFFVVANKTTNTFELTDAAGNNINSTVYTALSGSGTAARVYEIASPFDADAIDLLDINYSQATDSLTLVHPTYAQRELTITSATSWALAALDFTAPDNGPAGVTAAATVNANGGYSVSANNQYTVTTVIDDEESKRKSNDVISNFLWVAGNRNTITWTAVTGVDYYKVYKAEIGAGGGARTYGFIGRTDSESFSDMNIAPDYTRAPPVDYDAFGAVGDYPAATCYFQQRRVFAGTTNKPQTVWLTRSGFYSNMSRSEPLQDDDSIEFRIAARELNAIKHVVALDDLLLFTGSAVWPVRSQDGGALTPSTVSVKPTEFIGASNVQPVTSGGAVLFEESRGGHVYELAYTYEKSGYRARDISILAPHLVDGYNLADMAFATAPNKTLWAPRSDGKLLGLAYVPDQEVIAWHHHDTEASGEFESVAVVPEGAADSVYFIIKRTVNGRTVRNVERLQTEKFAAQADAFFVDSGLTYDTPGTPVTTVQGLWHLEGETVNILADGAVHPPQVVANGEVTLQQEAEKVHVGLKYTAQVQTLPLAYEAEALGQGTEKNLNAVLLRLYKSGSIFAGPSFDELKEFKQRTTEAYGSPPALYTGLAEITLDSDWNSDGQLCIQHDTPLPMTILSATLEVALGD